jgi:hypothetical protein
LELLVFKRLVLLSVLTATMVGVPVVAAGQVAEPGWSVGLEAGAAVVQRVGAVGGLQVAVRPAARVSFVIEAAYVQDLATRRRSALADDVAASLGQLQGRQASARMAVPAVVFTGGLRVALKTSGGVRPYVMAQAGIARATMEPTFVLAGADVTNALGQYGIALGSDLTGTTDRAAFVGGLGVLVGQNRWYLDASVRVLNVQLSDESTSAGAIVLGLGRRF